MACPPPPPNTVKDHITPILLGLSGHTWTIRLNRPENVCLEIWNNIKKPKNTNSRNNKIKNKKKSNFNKSHIFIIYHFYVI